MRSNVAKIDKGRVSMLRDIPREMMLRSVILATAVIQLVGRTTSFSSDEVVCGLNQTIEFRCLLAPTPPGNPRGLYGFEWKINNVSSISVEGARSNLSSRLPLLFLDCSTSLNNSLVQCVRVSLLSLTEPPAFGNLHTLRIQGKYTSLASKSCYYRIVPCRITREC